MLKSTPDLSVPPRVVHGYGLAGVGLFLLPPVVSLVWPSLTDPAALFAAAYGALILSFLGGARWGFEVTRTRPRHLVVALAMLPTLAGLALLLLPPGLRSLQLAGIALLLGVHYLWDLRAAGLPQWYPRLRSPLTAGAIFGLVFEAALTAAG